MTATPMMPIIARIAILMMLVSKTDGLAKKRNGNASAERSDEMRMSVPTPPFLKYFESRILSM